MKMSKDVSDTLVASGTFDESRKDMKVTLRHKLPMRESWRVFDLENPRWWRDTQDG
jgi:hypothetical protein